ncbi:MAG: riboflavin synthase [Proteobacteria bacterium]|nr:riboflavin synthase [bacterium AH-315-G11]PCI45218.1 MAG: riboflavin synthase [Pseudomonadota bacterium]
MFTGIIQDVGHTRHIKHEQQQSHMTFETNLDMSGWQLGDSVAVDGCCLTITDFPSKNTWSATLSLETLKLTTFSHAKIGKKVNMEPALCVGDALGGHIVTGHVDGLAQVKNITNIGEHKAFTFVAPQELARYIVKKGSVTLNGTSLTVNDVDECCFTVNLIPHTLSHTNLGQLQENDRVNIETDMFARYVERIMYFQNKSEETK